MKTSWHGRYCGGWVRNSPIILTYVFLNIQFLAKASATWALEQKLFFNLNVFQMFLCCQFIGQNATWDCMALKSPQSFKRTHEQISPSHIQWHKQIVQQWMMENRHLIPVEVYGFVQILPGTDGIFLILHQSYILVQGNCPSEIKRWPGIWPDHGQTSVFQLLKMPDDCENGDGSCTYLSSVHVYTRR